MLYNHPHIGQNLLPPQTLSRAFLKTTGALSQQVAIRDIRAKKTNAAGGSRIHRRVDLFKNDEAFESSIFEAYIFL